MKMGFIGAGKAGVSIGKYISERHAADSIGFYSRTFEHAEEAAAFCRGTAYATLRELVKASDTLVIAVSDSGIAQVWDCIAHVVEEEREAHSSESDTRIVCHLSGALSSVIFSENSVHNVYGCSMHPMYAFHDKFSSYGQLHQAFFTLEGEPQAVSAFCALLTRLGNSYAVISPESKMRYHCAASMASNHVIGLLAKSVSVLEFCGFAEQAAYEMLETLVKQNVANVFAKKKTEAGLCFAGTVEALTGPIERGDAGTVRKHLETLSDEDRICYGALGRELVRLSKEKHPKRDYSEIEAVLKEQ